MSYLTDFAAKSEKPAYCNSFHRDYPKPLQPTTATTTNYHLLLLLQARKRSCCHLIESTNLHRRLKSNFISLIEALHQGAQKKYHHLAAQYLLTRAKHHKKVESAKQATNVTPKRMRDSSDFTKICVYYYKLI